MTSLGKDVIFNKVYVIELIKKNNSRKCKTMKVVSEMEKLKE